jgi:hypothetical protein
MVVAMKNLLLAAILPQQVGPVVLGLPLRPPRFARSASSWSPDDASMLSSMAVDFCITRVVDGTLGVHGMIPTAIFETK